jgi:ubiquinone/menaquinone biosynthesis C-methylase UbiE
VDDPSRTTRDSYDAIGARFIENARDRATAMMPWLDRFAARLPPGARVLDLGAGPGMNTVDLRQRGLRAIGLDFSIGMLRAGTRDFPGPRVQGDARDLPVASAAVSGVWANASLHHLSREDAGIALREIRRVLRAPGLLCASLKQGAGSETESSRYGKPRFFQYWSGAELDAALDAAGFRIDDGSVNDTPRGAWLVRLASLRDVQAT